MQTSKSKTMSLPLFGTVRILIVAALLIAMSIVFGKVLAFNIGPLRISFENLPILMGGIFFGPLVGAVIGAAADIIGCLVVGYAINPIITAGAFCIGLTAGLVSRAVFLKNADVRLVISIFAAHIIGSMLVKSIGLMVYYGYTIESLILRIPLYIGISIVESSVIFTLMKNKAFTTQLERIRRK